jgi:hypothetical protein
MGQLCCHTKPPSASPTRITSVAWRRVRKLIAIEEFADVAREHRAAESVERWEIKANGDTSKAFCAAIAI